VCIGGGTQNGASITLGLGQEATCTITNNDKPPVLHLRKQVVNDNGGTKTVDDFTLTADGTGTNDLSGKSPVDSGSGLKGDTFALSETELPGYAAGAWVCQGGTQSGSSITLGVGQEATCTITNDDKPGTIVIIKNAKPATGTFTFTTTSTAANQGPASAWPATFTLTGSTTGDGNRTSFTVNAGNYTVQESTQLGWILTGIGGSNDPNRPYDCTTTGSGASSGTGDLNTQKIMISVKNGETVTCVFENTGTGATRTQGFWATHSQLANLAWFGGSAFSHTFPGVAGVAAISDTTLCGRSIDTLAKVMGGFWSDVSKTTTAKKRTSLDQSRMRLLQQFLAGELNAAAFGSAPPSGSFTAWEAAYCGTNGSALQTAQQQAASFNSSGDSATFTPGISADSKTGRSIADRAFWDVLP
jgi:Prealbumin-like fold domain